MDTEQALAAKGQPEQNVLLDVAGVVVHYFHEAGLHDAGRAVSQVAFQTAAAQQARLPPIGGEEHERARLRIRRTLGVAHHGHATHCAGRPQGPE